MNTINKWKSKLDLDDWSISSERISPKQVTYDMDIPDNDRYFIGVSIDHDNKIAVIYHDTDLYEEATLHELLHVRYPDKDEDWVNENTGRLMIKDKQK